MPDTFAALDFETADYGRDSACALSVVRVDGSRIVDQQSFLIRPPREEFVFTYIHGITWADVARAPVFAEIWEKAAPLLEDARFVAAHNASFDRSVLKACCLAAEIPLPEHTFLCTVKMARNLWNIFPTKLPDVCDRLRIALNHHDAASDALACAKIAIAARKEGALFDEFFSKPARKKAPEFSRRKRSRCANLLA